MVRDGDTTAVDGTGCEMMLSLSLMSTVSGFRWGIPLNGGGGGPVMTGEVAPLSSASLSEPVQTRFVCSCTCCCIIISPHPPRQLPAFQHYINFLMEYCKACL